MKVRYVIKFTKESEIKFVAHLDLMRTIQRIFRRAMLPVEYSKGFNPHMNLSIAQPLSVGIYSKGEYMDVVFLEEVNEQLILDKLNANAPLGIKFIKAIKLPVISDGKKIPQIMAMLDGASYTINIQYENTDALAEEINELLNKPQWYTIKRTKSGEKEVDIKPFVKEFKYSISGENIKIDTVLACGSRENLSPELLSEYIKKNTSQARDKTFVEIMRKDMYTLKEEALVTVDSFFA